MDHLREALDSAQHELEHLRRQRLHAASSSSTLPLTTAGTAATAAEEQRIALRLQCTGDEVAARLEVQPGADDGPNGRVASPQLPAALAAVARAAATGDGGGTGSVDPQLLQAAAAALVQLAQAQGTALPGLASPLPALANGEAADGPPPSAPSWQEQRAALQAQLGRLQAELAQAQQDASYARDAAERKVAEMRGRSAEAQQRQGELLRVAQDGRLEAGASLPAWRGRQGFLVSVCGGGFFYCFSWWEGGRDWRFIGGAFCVLCEAGLCVNVLCEAGLCVEEAGVATAPAFVVPAMSFFPLRSHPPRLSPCRVTV